MQHENLSDHLSPLIFVIGSGGERLRHFERNCFVVLKGKSGDVTMKRLKVRVYLLMLYSVIAIYSRKEHLHRKKSRTSRDRRDDTTHAGASLETHN